MKRFLIILVALMLGSDAYAGCINIYGTAYCPPPGGGAVNIYGTAYCGLGQCVNIYGTAYCSSQKDGSAMNIYGQAKCTGGCVRGNSNLCEIIE
tara:strand:+ start:192 stop:473 length:282 start_codon:yes stop_codon:yes gene_type:complete